jgi:hypothetical protein
MAIFTIHWPILLKAEDGSDERAVMAFREKKKGSGFAFGVEGGGQRARVERTAGRARRQSARAACGRG